ncbi:DUF2062 domain-containing protein [Hymenobacter sp. BT18]|uniref:DUF2062 domain-containing protein n=1 Tax=Hymenobacter sp. BT18 TaxID=2835648 RepID=UPI00143E335F|nr:DUF2062 domain-containing protein [Hymenobacter sp. BT18]QIX60044.1 DUF2062 domain-containing protein [Hymenobacter sp. BT18]
MLQPLPPPDASGPPAPPDGWLRRKVIQPALAILRQGLSPKQLALTVALGVSFGLVPLLGVTTLLASFVALRLRLNVAAMLLVSHLMSPLQLLVMIPLLQWGGRLLSGGHAPQLTLSRLQYYFAHDWAGGLQLLWRAELGALLLWAGLSVPLGLLLYLGLQPVFKRLAARQPAAVSNAQQAEEEIRPE